MGKVTAAMNVVAQRTKAIERSQADGNWEAAQWLELIPTGQVQLVPRDESRLALKEAEAESEFRDRNRKGPAVSNKKEDKGDPVD